MDASRIAKAVGVGGSALAVVILTALAFTQSFGWSSQCSTTWNGSGWTSCLSTPVTATSTGEATCIATAPECSANGGSRYARATHGITQDARADCPGGTANYTAACCATAYWTAQSGTQYAARGYNTSTVQACGPTTAKIQSSHINCTPDGPE